MEAFTTEEKDLIDSFGEARSRGYGPYYAPWIALEALAYPHPMSHFKDAVKSLKKREYITTFTLNDGTREIVPTKKLVKLLVVQNPGVLSLDDAIILLEEDK
jgi:hypothetical protein